MSPLKTQMLTGVVTLMLGACIAASWLHFRPLEIPRFARVDIGTIVAQQQQSLVQRVKPGMDAVNRASCSKRQRLSACVWIQRLSRLAGSASVP
jgi:hypothetical protein